ncbi:hypothetical protein Pla52n_23130 [Stieleria varia]|uniref:Uncharacterized protein n=1 Tax=Stieleria varia TaxID=2528005 RepID=A0A5C6B1H1_9BACT|nr:hypothetical protein Pla52n_23130 [Stieleria varia]
MTKYGLPTRKVTSSRHAGTICSWLALSLVWSGLRHAEHDLRELNVASRDTQSVLIGFVADFRFVV